MGEVGSRDGQASGSVPDHGKRGKGPGKFGMVVVAVLQFSVEIVGVRAHIEVPVSGKIEDDGARATLRLATYGLVDGATNGMCGFGRGQNSLGARKTLTCLETLRLVVGACLGQPQRLQMADDGSHAVISKSSGMNIHGMTSGSSPMSSSAHENTPPNIGNK